MGEGDTGGEHQDRLIASPQHAGVRPRETGIGPREAPPRMGGFVQDRERVTYVERSSSPESGLYCETS